MAARTSRSIRWLGMVPALFACACGEEWGTLSWGKPKEPTTRPAGTLEDTPTLASAQLSLALEGTVGASSYVEGVRLMSVRGIGLVVNLQGKGSVNCPTSVRDYLTKEIRRYRAANADKQAGLPSPDQLISSLDTAAVEVLADVPAGAAVGRTFDVVVRAIDPDTQSLEGGFLWPCDLRIYQESSGARMIEGKIHARAQGPVFVNPFLGEDGSAGAGHVLEGRVIGGGANVEERKLALVTTISSYSVVQQIAQAINRRFHADPPLAEGMSPTNIDLRIPPEYRGRERRFLDIVTHLPLSTSAAHREARAKALVGELARADAPLEHVALSIEGLGQPALGVLKPLYSDPRRQVNYYAGRTGLRLGDDLAIEVMVNHANDERSPFRTQAIRELGQSAMPDRAGAALQTLLTDSDARIRILAYEALREVHPRAMLRLMVGGDPGNFILDVVPSEGPAMIYARRTEVRRIALIGGDQLRCRPPLLYAPDGKPVVLTADSGDGMITVVLKVPRSNGSERRIGPFKAPLSVSILTQFLGHTREAGPAGELKGLALDYAVVLDALFQLCKQGAITADFRWEEPSVEDLVGPLEPMGRPETDL